MRGALMSDREMTETKTWRMIERQKGAQQRLGSGNTHFNQNFVLRDPDDPFVPGVVGTDGTPIPRLKPVPLGKRAIGFFSDEIDALQDALRYAQRITPLVSPRPQAIREPIENALKEAGNIEPNQAA